MASTLFCFANPAAAAKCGTATWYEGNPGAAHRTKPIGSYITITRKGLSVTIKVTNRGPFTNDIVDLPPWAFKRLGAKLSQGRIRVCIH